MLILIYMLTLILYSELVETIHVKLSHKWWEIGVFIVFWQYLLTEFGDVEDNEGCFIIPPPDYLTVRLIFKDVVQFIDENGCFFAFTIFITSAHRLIIELLNLLKKLYKSIYQRITTYKIQN